MDTHVYRYRLKNKTKNQNIGRVTNPGFLSSSNSRGLEEKAPRGPGGGQGRVHKEAADIQ